MALVSVFSLSLPIFKEFYSTKNSEVRVTFQDAQGRYLFMIATNTGAKPGTVGRANLVISDLQGIGFPETRRLPDNRSLSIGSRVEGIVPLTADGWDKEKTFISAGAARPLKLYPREGKVIELFETDEDRAAAKLYKERGVWIGRSMPKMTCRLEVEVIQFDGTRDMQVYAPSMSSIEGLRLQVYVRENLLKMKGPIGR